MRKSGGFAMFGAVEADQKAGGDGEEKTQRNRLPVGNHGHGVMWSAPSESDTSYTVSSFSIRIGNSRTRIPVA